MIKTDCATLKRIKMLSQFVKGKEVLDIGCRDGVLKNFLPRNTKYTGLEKGLDSHNNESSTVFLKDGILDSKIKTIFGKKKFDTVVLAETIEHLPDPVAALKNIKLLLKNHGQLVGSVPNAVAWRYFFFLELFGNTKPCNNDWGHLFAFDKLILKNLLNYCDFKVEKIEEWGNWIPHTGIFFPFNKRGAHLLFIAESS